MRAAGGVIADLMVCEGTSVFLEPTPDVHVSFQVSTPPAPQILPQRGHLRALQSGLTPQADPSLSGSLWLGLQPLEACGLTRAERVSGTLT